MRKSTGFNIEIISGKEEAEILYANHLTKVLTDDKYYLYVDVGGGSTELSLLSGKNLIASQSFNIGTIRILRNQVGQEEFHFFEQWLARHVGNQYPGLQIIGSGGNINKLFKEAGVKKGNPLRLEELRSVYQDIKSYSVEERMVVFGFKPDRADVIIRVKKHFIHYTQKIFLYYLVRAKK